jgi:hypothetical protein
VLLGHEAARRGVDHAGQRLDRARPQAAGRPGNRGWKHGLCIWQRSDGGDGRNQQSESAGAAIARAAAAALIAWISQRLGRGSETICFAR